MKIALKHGPERLSVEVAGREVAVTVRRNARARRMILRIDDATGLPVLTLPSRMALSKADDFLQRHTDWLAPRLRKQARAVPLRAGSVIPLRGAPCRILHRGGRGLVGLRKDDDGLFLSVPGEAAFLPRRTMEWLKRRARRDLEAAVERHSEALGKKPKSVRIGDAKSRWGSCSSRGVLTFSWRLVLAPPYVLDYLAAHEVAHLAQMNHGPRFWALVDRLVPGHETARNWLRAHGGALYAIGRSP